MAVADVEEASKVASYIQPHKRNRKIISNYSSTKVSTNKTLQLTICNIVATVA